MTLLVILVIQEGSLEVGEVVGLGPRAGARHPRRDTLEGEHIPIRCPVTIPVHWGMTDSQDSKAQRSSEPDCGRPSPSNPDPELQSEEPVLRSRSCPTLSPTLEGFVGLDEDESSAAEIHEAAEELADALFAAAEPPDPNRRIRTRTRVRRTRP